MIRLNVRGMRKAALCLGAGLAILSGATPASALNSRSWNGYTWSRTGNLNITLVNNVSAAWAPYLQTAASQWSAATSIDYNIVASTGTSPSSCSPSYGVVEVCSGNYGANGWLGMTNVYTSRGHIVMATVRWNDYYLQSARYNTSAWYSATACHELGHVLGLNHTDENRNNANSGSCLDYTNDPTGGSRANASLSDVAPGAMDFAALAAIYGTSSSTSVSGMSMSSDGLMVPEPGIWAMMIGGFGLVGLMMRRRFPVTGLRQLAA